MKKWLKLSLWIVLIVLVGIQFVPVQRNEIEPVTNADFIEHYESPIVIGNIIRASCYDCHSNQTKYPWYSNVQPIGFLLQNHISEGKSELNLSEYGLLSNRMKRAKLKSILSQINDDKMPMPSYLLLHSEAKLDSLKKALLVSYLDSILVDIDR
ncbi:heme-binding domain-containing protein [Algoriphagus formosus]|uniref:heme-binding domain-containing protein n=1 Tax=Algoriphagus formosus TaxID=2007308 RepID=UPI003F70B0A1